MSNKYNLGIIGEIAEMNNNMDVLNIKELKLEDVTNIEQATKYIKENDSKVTAAWFNLAHALKKVRDEKLFKEKYQTFEEYYENELSYGRAMVFRFLKVADTFPLDTKHELINYGITKLISLVELPEPERDDLLENHDVENMTTSELKVVVKQYKTLNTNNFERIFKFTEEEQKAVRALYTDLTGFHSVIEKIALKVEEGEELSHEKVFYLSEVLEKTKKEMKQVEKMIKKYI